MDMAQEIRQRLTVREVVEVYGFQVNRSGFMKCPWHSGDHTASLKLYDGQGGFHCFACGAHGSVIDFVMRLFDLNFRQAILRINADFRLGLTESKPDRAAQSVTLEARREEQRKNAQAEANFQFMIREFQYWKEIRNTFQPIRQGDVVFYHPLYAEAVKRLPYIEYWLDDFVEKGGKEHWGTCPFTQETTTSQQRNLLNTCMPTKIISSS